MRKTTAPAGAGGLDSNELRFGSESLEEIKGLSAENIETIQNLALVQKGANKGRVGDRFNRL